MRYIIFKKAVSIETAFFYGKKRTNLPSIGRLALFNHLIQNLTNPKNHQDLFGSSSLVGQAFLFVLNRCYLFGSALTILSRPHL